MKLGTSILFCVFTYQLLHDMIFVQLIPKNNLPSLVHFEEAILFLTLDQSSCFMTPLNRLFALATPSSELIKPMFTEPGATTKATTAFNEPKHFQKCSCRFGFCPRSRRKSVTCKTKWSSSDQLFALFQFFANSRSLKCNPHTQRYSFLTVVMRVDFLGSSV